MSWLGWGKKKQCLHVHGWKGCGYFSQAIELAKAEAENDKNIEVHVIEVERSQWYKHLDEKTKELGVTHSTSPLVFEGCVKEEVKFIGGCSDLRQRIISRRKGN